MTRPARAALPALARAAVASAASAHDPWSDPASRPPASPPPPGGSPTPGYAPAPRERLQARLLAPVLFSSATFYSGPGGSALAVSAASPSSRATSPPA